MRFRDFFVHLPNLITLARLILVPIVILMIASGRWAEAFILFLVAGVSDAIDGFLAKRFDLRTELGAYLDPIADKALLVSIYVVLAVKDIVPLWITVLVVFRDVLIVGAVVVSWLMDKPVEIRPLLVSKLNTAAQIGFAVFVLAAKAFGWPLGLTFEMALGMVATLTALSAAAYFAQWFQHMTGEGGAG